ncbi:MAG: SprB repeat-containing protein, partial [Bacteroidetes bacterium]|nr:SprB repeat-containing protein [Bacteroidota bacterium]
MRKLLFSTAMLSFFMYANAQITIDSTDYATVGDTIFMANDTIPIDTGISVGGTGFQIWDFTNLSLDEFDTIIFVHPDSTLFGGSFPTSNLATDDTIITNYQTSSAAQLTNDGFAGDPFGFGVTTPAVFDPAQTVMEYPSIYGSSFDDTSAFVEAIDVALLGIAIPDTSLDSIRMKHISYVYSEINAYGTVYLPSDSFAVLRQYYEENTIDTLEWYCSNPIGCLFGLAPFGWSFINPAISGIPNPILDTTYTYRWLANGEDFPVVEIETDTVAGNVLSARFKIGNAVTAWVTSKTDVLCNGDCNGQAAVMGLSGVFPYSYQWKDSAGVMVSNADTAGGLCVGTYTVMVIDAVPDTAYATVTIGEPAIITASVASIFIGCNGDSGKSITVSAAGGTPPYEYST